MRSFRRHLKEKLKDERFRRLYEEERQLTELSLKIHHMRATVGAFSVGGRQESEGHAAAVVKGGKWDQLQSDDVSKGVPRPRSEG